MILHSGVNSESEIDNDDNQPLCSLNKKLPESFVKTDVSEWMKNHKQCEVTGISIIKIRRKSEEDL